MPANESIKPACLFAAAGTLLAAATATTVAADLNVPSDYRTIGLALDAAVAGDTILVAEGVYFEHDLVVDKVVTIVGEGGPELTVIDASQLGRVFHVTADATIMGFTIRDGFSNTLGGAMLIETAAPTLDGCLFLENTVVSAGEISGGGAIWCDDADVVVTDCTFEGNRAVTTDDEPTTGLAGAIFFANGSDGFVTGCTFVENAAEGGAGLFGNAIGGVAYIGASNDTIDPPRMPSHVTMDTCTFADNSAVIAAGALFVDGAAAGSTLPPSSLVMTDCFFSGNSAGNGGAMTIFGSSVADLDECSFVYNTSTSPDIGGGAISAGFFETTTLTDCDFKGNTSAVGGAISGVAGSSHTLIDCLFSANSATIAGGAVYNSSFFGFPSTMTLVGCTFSSNTTVGSGGAVANVDDSTLVATGCLFARNTAMSSEPLTGNGGAIYGAGDGASLLIESCDFTSNRAVTTDPDGFFDGTGLGGAMSISNGATATVLASDFDGNVAVSPGVGGNGIGGAIFLSPADPTVPRLPSHLTVEESTFTGNSASISGGAMWLQGDENAPPETEPSTASVTGCQFVANSAQAGSGIFAFSHMDVDVTGCAFSRNWTYEENDFFLPGLQGGGPAIAAAMFCEPLITDCTFDGNSSLGLRGGAIFNAFANNMTIVNCEFTRNRAALGGGAVSNEAATALFGGAPATLTMINCLVTMNLADEGGGILNIEGGTLTLINLTIGDNIARDGGGGGVLVDGAFEPAEGDPIPSTAEIINSIVWGNRAAPGLTQIGDLTGETTVTYSIVQRGWIGLGNMPDDPLWIGPGNYRLQPGSPAIDTGNNAVVTMPFDLDGNDRIVNDVVDLGAYEFQGDDG